MKRLAMASITGLSTLLLSVAFAMPALAASAKQEPAGTLSNGSEVSTITLRAKNGVSAKILSYGATLQSLSAPDRNGKVADVVLGYDTLAGYVDHPNYFGVTVGRYANRIAGGKFVLDGQTFQLPLNNGTNSLHGGTKGFDKLPWKVVSVKSGPVASVVLSLTSADGDQGYPGTLTTQVTYSLDEAGNLTIAMEAQTDKPTIVNMTNHAIFNMAGEGAAKSAMENRLTIAASTYTPVNDKLIPTGELRKVAGSVFDFRLPRTVAAGLRDGRDQQIIMGRGYDHNYALDKGVTAKPQFAARLEDPASGRVLEVLTTEPGIQFYSGNFLDGTLVGKGGHVYRMGDGIALEPQKFPNAPNQPSFVSARVDPGKPYRHVMVYRVTTSPKAAR